MLLITFFVLFFLKFLMALKAENTITNARKIYAKNLIYISVDPAPYNA